MGLDAYLVAEEPDGTRTEMAYFRKDYVSRDFIINTFNNGDFDDAYAKPIRLSFRDIARVLEHYVQCKVQPLIHTTDAQHICYNYNKVMEHLALWFNAYAAASCGEVIYYHANW